MIWISLGKVKLVYFGQCDGSNHGVAVLIGVKFGLSGVCWAL